METQEIKNGTIYRHFKGGIYDKKSRAFLFYLSLVFFLWFDRLRVVVFSFLFLFVMMKVAVLRGGIGTEREISLISWQEILNHLDRNKYQVFDIKFDSPSKLIEELQHNDFDFAYIALHGAFGEDGMIQAILESLNIPYTGSGVLSSAVAMDKDLSKRILQTYDVVSPKGKLLKKTDEISWKDLEFLGKRMIVKPNQWWSSVGVSLVSNQNELDFVLSNVFEINDEALIEEALLGVEISVPIVGGVVYPTIEIQPLMWDFFDYESKYAPEWAREIIYDYPNLDLKNVVEQITKTVFSALKCKGFARVDYILVGEQPYFLEINTLPGMTANSLLPKSLISTGKTYSEILDILIEVSMSKK